MKYNGKSKKKSFLALALLMILVMGTVLTGCGSKDDSTPAAAKKTETGSAGQGLTRAEYIGLLGEKFGLDQYASESDIFKDVNSSNPNYAQIQASAEWEVIDRDAEFRPDDAATLAFALESAVRAVGTEDIAATGEAIDTGKLAEFYVSHIAQIDLGDGQAAVNSDMAEQIIAYAKDYDGQLVIPQKVEYEFQEGVKLAGMDVRINADGKTGVLSAASGYQTGDIVYIPATDSSLPRGIKITDIKGESFQFEDVSVEEIFSDFSIQGTFDGEIVNFTAASDASTAGLADEIYEEMKNYSRGMSSTEDYLAVQLANSLSPDIGKDHLIITASFDVQKSTKYTNKAKQNYTNMSGENKPEFSDEGSASASANGKLVVGITNIDITPNYTIRKPTEGSVDIKFDTEVHAELNGNVATTIPLGEMDIQIGGPLSPLYVRVYLEAHIGADGTVKIDYTTNNVASIGWKPDRGLYKDFDSKAKADLHADATLTAEASLLVDLRAGWGNASKSVVNAQITAGAVAHAELDADFMGDQPTCADVQLYLTAEWGVNQRGCVVTDLNGDWKFKKVIWNSENSPVKLHMHFEDWQRTQGDVCTRKEPVEQELTTPEGEPLPEIDPFEFEPLVFDFIELDSYVMYLGEGESMDIGFVNIPEGYSQSDLVYEVEDSSICTVSGGRVTAGKAGSTLVKIRTSDGTFAVSLAVTVNEDYSIEGFQSL